MLGSFPARRVSTRARARSPARGVPPTLEHAPLDALAADGLHLARERGEQRGADAAAAELVEHEQVLEVYAGRAAPRRVVVEVQRHAGGLAGRREREDHLGVRWVPGQEPERARQRLLGRLNDRRFLLLVRSEPVDDAQDERNVWQGRQRGARGGVWRRHIPEPFALRRMIEGADMVVLFGGKAGMVGRGKAAIAIVG